MKINTFRQFVDKISIVALMMVFGFTVLVPGGQVFAEDKQPYRITIDDTGKDLKDIEPGSTETGSFNVRNDGTERFKFDITYSPLSVANEEYTYDFDKETQYTDLCKWISVDVENGELDPGEVQNINWTVKIPSDTHGGAQVGVILITMNPMEKQDNGINVTRQLGYIIYGNVDGDLIRTAKILEHKVPSFLFNPPVTVSSVVENTGNVYTRAQYTLQVFPLFSDEEIYTNEEKPENSLIFPETKRLNQDTWEGAPSLGIFRVRSVVKIFDEESVVDKLVFLCPIWFLFLIVLIIILIIVWIVTRIMKRRNEA